MCESPLPAWAGFGDRAALSAPPPQVLLTDTHNVRIALDFGNISRVRAYFFLNPFIPVNITYMLYIETLDCQLWGKCCYGPSVKQLGDIEIK